MNKSEEFFRVEYRKGIDMIGDDCVTPCIWFGVQGFDLIKQYKDDEMTAMQHAEWYVSMFKKGLETYHQSRVNAVSDEEIKEIIFKNQCYGNSTKAAKEIKQLLKQ